MRKEFILHYLIQQISRLNWGVLCLVIVLGIIGSAMLYSASGGSLYPWALPHMIRYVMSFGLMLFIALLPLRIIMQSAYPFYGLCVLMLIVVEVMGSVGMGAQRWINLGVINLQPSELTKIAIVLVLARYFHTIHADNIRKPILLVPALLFIAIPALLILIQPNLGTMSILLAISVIMLFVAGISYYYFVVGGVGLLAALPIAWEFLHDYQKRRVLTFLDPSQDPLGAGYNITQSMIAIGSGGLDGRGFLKGSQGQLNFLPEKQTDFIFTMLAEETGFIGAILLLFLYGALMFYAMRIALQSKNDFGALVTMGITAMLFVHIMVNVGMVMGLMPVVGVPLPFLSYGGSFLISTMMAMGLLLNAHLHKGTSLERGARLM